MTETEAKKIFYERAREVSNKDDFDAFVTYLREQPFDYGTVVYAAAAVMMAALRYADLGLTGFQAGFVGWEMVEYLMLVKRPCKIVDYKNMLYPQYREKFEKTISPKVWKILQEEASDLLEQKAAAPHIIEHWQSIVNGNIPFGYEVVIDE